MLRLEYALTSGSAKARAIVALRRAGFEVGTGPIRLAYPFTVQVDVDATDVDLAWRIVNGIDPCSGQVVAPSSNRVSGGAPVRAS